MTVEPQPAGPTFARSARVHDVRTYIYIYIYKKHIYIYDEDFSPLYDKCGARSARRLNTKLIDGGITKNHNYSERSLESHLNDFKTEVGHVLVCGIDGCFFTYFNIDIRSTPSP